MPLRDKAGKRLSGSQQRKRAAAIASTRMSKAAREAFAALGPPPLDNPDTLLAWARKILSIATWLVASDQLDPSRARVIKDLAFGLGATHSRAQLEHAVEKIEKSIALRQGAGNTIVRLEKGSKIKRPPTARGQQLPGPRALSDSDALPPEPDPEPSKE